VKKYEFLAELEHRLDGLSASDLKASLDYYAEIIDDRIDDGMDEEAAVESIGTPAEAAAQILGNPQSKRTHTDKKQKKPLGALAITLIILGSPIWLSLAAAGFSIIAGIAAVVFSVWVSVWAAFATIAGCAVGCVIGCVFVIINNGAGLGIAMLGAGLFAGGLAIFAFFGCVAFTNLLVRGIKGLFAFIKRKVIRKEAVQ
jgi:uncharacterized membrane protein